MVGGELSNVHSLCNLKSEVFSSSLFTGYYGHQITHVEEQVSLLWFRIGVRISAIVGAVVGVAALLQQSCSGQVRVGAQTDLGGCCCSLATLP